MIHNICKDIIFNLNINKFVETGTFIGETLARVSYWFQDLDPHFGNTVDSVPNEYLYSFFPKRKICYPLFKNAKIDARTKVYSIDIDTEKQGILKRLFLSNPNINVICDSSEKFLKKAIDNGLISDMDSCFFFLDAHWDEYWPLRDEIREILRLKRSVIAIDDFVVPFRPLHLFGVYNNKACGWYYIRDLFRGYKTAIYYPKRSNLDYRGIVIIFVGYEEGRLKFMHNLPCFRPIFFKGDPFLTKASETAFKFFKPYLDRLGKYLMHNVQKKNE